MEKLRSLTPSQSSEPNAERLNITEIRDAYFAANPDATSLYLKDQQGEGFEFYPDGSFTQRSKVDSRSKIFVDNGHSVCVEPVGSWSGGCLSLFRLPDGRIQSIMKYGNDRENAFIVQNMTL